MIKKGRWPLHNKKIIKSIPVKKGRWPSHNKKIIKSIPVKKGRWPSHNKKIIKSIPVKKGRWSSHNKKINNKFKKRKQIEGWKKPHVWENRYEKCYEVLCFICKTNKITPFNFECGHIISHYHGGSNDIDNLDAICRQCNKDMRTIHMSEFIKERTRQINNLKKRI